VEPTLLLINNVLEGAAANTLHLVDRIYCKVVSCGVKYSPMNALNIFFVL